MRIYLSARYPRRAEIRRKSDDIPAEHELASRWIYGQHEGVARERCAQDDLEDIAAADTLILFTESPDVGYYQGGRMVELGIALHSGKRVILCGPRENVFTYLPQVEQYDTWEEVLRKL